MTEPRHGDPFDYPDIPGDSGLSDAYFEAVTPPAVKAAIAKRRSLKATPGGSAAIVGDDPIPRSPPSE